MAFPTSPSNDDLHTEFGRTFKYSSATNSWSSATPDAPEDNTPITQGYVDAQSLPLTGVAAGSKAFVQDGNKLFIFTGSGWFEIATINNSPSITTGADASYALEPSGDPTVITLQATDPEGTPIVWSYQVTSGSLEDTTVTNVDNVFTITPGASSTTFNLSFIASDGVNLDTSASNFTVAVLWSFQGSVAGYAAGNFPTTYQIQTFPFASEGNVTDFGDLTVARYQTANASSPTHGYTAGGYSLMNNIDKFAFATAGNATDVGDLSSGRHGTPAGNSSPDNGYISGGRNPHPTVTNTIQKISFTTDGNATISGTLTTTLAGASGGNNTADVGYIPMGNNSVNKLLYASDQNATSSTVTFSAARGNASAQSSSTHGYLTGGTVPSQSGLIEKYPFASEGVASTVGNLTTTRYGTIQSSSTVSGYALGGSFPNVSTMDKFSFSTDADASNVGNLLSVLTTGTGMQY